MPDLSPAYFSSAALDWLDAAAADRRARHLNRTLRPRAADNSAIDLASNDYLGLGAHPEVVQGAIDATRRWGAGASGSRLVTGTTADHHALETELAAFTGHPSALVFSSGYTANLGAVVALSGRGSLIVSDGSSHASLVDACRLSRARVVVVARGDVAAVERALAGRSEERALVVTDSVYSTDGLLAPLTALHRACERHGAVLLADEAHGLGVRGAGGRGLVDELGLTRHENVVATATLSKALGAQGGVVLASERVREHLVDTARAFIFDAGLAPASVGAARAALAVLRREPERARRVLEVAEQLAAVTGADRPASAVVSVILGDAERAYSAAQRCAALGLQVGCFRPPSVPEGTARLRLTARADIPEADLATACDVLVRVLTEHWHSVADDALTGAASVAHARDRRRAGHGRGAPMTSAAANSVRAAPLIVTGTGTGVGKTVATAALAVLGRSAGMDVGICKPIQTGLAPGEPGDAHEAARLSGAERVLEVRRLADPLAPETAARVAGLPQSTRSGLLVPIREWLHSFAPAGPTHANSSPTRPTHSDRTDGASDRPGRLDLIEGAGGLLVRLGTNLTILDLAAELRAPLVVVARAGLGTLSDTELTVRAIESAGLLCAGIVVGSWPFDPDLAERCNLEDLPCLTGVPVLGRIPYGAGGLTPAEFGRWAPGWFEAGARAALRA